VGEAVRRRERYFEEEGGRAWENDGVASLQLSKYHGLGNDFLVLVDLLDCHRLGPSAVRRLCDRRRGVGADGLIRVLAGRDGAAVAMELHNADGSLAETSGNGLRCLAQAVREAGAVVGTDFVISTPAGPRPVSVGPGQSPGEVIVRVDMGVPQVGPDQSQPGQGRRRTVGMGNPHLVLIGAELGPQLGGTDPDGLGGAELAALGPRLQAGHPNGINIELVTVGPEPGQLTMGIWERGVGETLACGTGSVAAAAAARAWGLVGERVLVNNPGGPLEVDLSGPTAVLTGPSQQVATILVDLL